MTRNVVKNASCPTWRWALPGEPPPEAMGGTASLAATILHVATALCEPVARYERMGVERVKSVHPTPELLEMRARELWVQVRPVMARADRPLQSKMPGRGSREPESAAVRANRGTSEELRWSR